MDEGNRAESRVPHGVHGLPKVDYLAEMMERKGRLSLAEAWVVLTPLSMIMPAWGEGTFRDTSLWSTGCRHLLTPSLMVYS